MCNKDAFVRMQWLITKDAVQAEAQKERKVCNERWRIKHDDTSRMMYDWQKRAKQSKCNGNASSCHKHYKGNMNISRNNAINNNQTHESIIKCKIHANTKGWPFACKERTTTAGNYVAGKQKGLKIKEFSSSKTCMKTSESLQQNTEQGVEYKNSFMRKELQNRTASPK